MAKDQQNKVEINKIRGACEAAVKRPGAYEGQARYVPYFWEHTDGSDEDTGEIQGYLINGTDHMVFPELRIGEWVYLIQTDQGFVEEVDSLYNEDICEDCGQPSSACECEEFRAEMDWRAPNHEEE